MKTNFLPRNKRNIRSKRNEFFLLSGVFLIGAIGASFLGKYFSIVFMPIWNSDVLTESGVPNLIGSLREKDVLVKENTELKEKMASQDELVISLKTIVNSYDDLLKTFGRERTAGIPASVLVHPPETPYDILIIDAGSNLGVLMESLVTTPEGSALGNISEVSPQTSRVRLYSTSGERTDAVLERGGISVTLIGRGGGNFETSVPRDTVVQIGDRVLLSTLESVLVGVVGNVESTPTDSFKSVLIKSPTNPTHQRFVLVKQ